MAELRWQLVQRRQGNTADEGPFVYAVRTTGIFCRVGCPSRLPKRENVLFFDTPQLAVAAGFRACKRCQPDRIAARDPAAMAVQQVCQLIEANERPTRLADLAAAVGYSPAHLQKVFKTLTGVSPREYATSQRLRRAAQQLSQGSQVASALYAAGYETSSRFYADSKSLGLSPGEIRRGAPGRTLQAATTSTWLGTCLIAATEKGLCHVELGDDAEVLQANLRRRFAQAEINFNDESFADWVRQFVAFLEQPERGCQLPLDIQGTAFQCRVWEALRKIPAGSTVTYTQLAETIGQPKAARSVASACAANQMAVVVPCHRVVRNDGTLSGYRWGVDRKRRLIEQEAKQSAGDHAD